ncbi:MAG TPA: hypothetical protein VH835_01375 [Dongiaceae bacterium]
MTMSELCRQFQVSRKTGYEVLGRWRAGAPRLWLRAAMRRIIVRMVSTMSGVRLCSVCGIGTRAGDRRRCGHGWR